MPEHFDTRLLFVLGVRLTVFVEVFDAHVVVCVTRQIYGVVLDRDEVLQVRADTATGLPGFARDRICFDVQVGCVGTIVGLGMS